MRRQHANDNYSPVKNYEYKLDDKALNEIFEWVNKPAIYYDWATNEYNPFDKLFALVDSLGEIRLLANIRTEGPTRDHYKKNHSIDLPMSKNMSPIITALIFGY